MLATGSAEVLKPYMCEADVFVQPGNREKLVIVAQDATPVYLDISTGKILVSDAVLDDARS